MFYLTLKLLKLLLKLLSDIFKRIAVYKLDLEDINYKNTEYTPLRAYANSKIANILFAKALDLKLKVCSFCLHLCLSAR